MHIYFSGIGGTGIGPLALIAQQAGFTVSGSDKQTSQYTDYLQKNGVTLHIGQDTQGIESVHTQNPIDWIVFSSAVMIENSTHPELLFAQRNNIKTSKRGEFLEQLLATTGQKMLAVAGTHGKTTTTAMLVWLCKQIGVPISYSVGAKMSFGPMGHFDKDATYFVYECDEFDRNFLEFHPAVSGITTVDWDHHEIYPTRDDYKSAFVQFISQSESTIIYTNDSNYLGIDNKPGLTVLQANNSEQNIKLAGAHNRQNALIAIEMVIRATNAAPEKLYEAINSFPGTERRFEQVAPNIYSDYAHTPEEVAATLQLASELSKNVVAVYEPLTNRRQHYMKDHYAESFKNTKALYWLPSYMAREDPEMHLYTPQELISHLPQNINSQAAELNDDLKIEIKAHVESGDIVVCMAGGGGGSLDEWIKKNFKE